MKDWAMIRVHPDFKKKLQRLCLDEDLPIIDLTEKLAKSPDPFEGKFKKINKNFGRFL